MQYNQFGYNNQPYHFSQFNETLSLSDAAIKSPGKNTSETIFLSDLLTRQITNKGLIEQLYLLDWLANKQTNKQWFD